MATLRSKTLARFCADERGASLVEYAVALLIVAAMGVGVMEAIGNAVSSEVSEYAAAISGSGGGTGTSMGGTGTGTGATGGTGTGGTGTGTGGTEVQVALEPGQAQAPPVEDRAAVKGAAVRAGAQRSNAALSAPSIGWKLG